MSATKLNDLATRILRSSPTDNSEQKRILRLLNEVRDSLRWSSDQQPVVEYLDAATLLISYLAHMGHIGGSEIRSVVARLIETGAKVIEDGKAPASPEAAEAALAATQALDATILGQDPVAPAPPAEEAPSNASARVISDMLLGEVMVRMGHIQSAHIDKALEVQRQTGLKFGEALVKLGVATWEQVQAGLRYQDGCRQVVENFVDTRTQQPESQSQPKEQQGLQPSGAPQELELASSQPAQPPSNGGGNGLDVAGSHGDSALRLMSDVLLGEILIERGIISKSQLEQGLATQRATGMRIGEALVSLRFCNWDQVEMGIRLQGQRRKYQAGGSGH